MTPVDVGLNDDNLEDDKGHGFFVIDVTKR
jgi:hypothetical protein